MNPALAALGVGLIRNVSGWLNASLEDEEIQAYEWKRLVSTILRTGAYTGFAYIGLKSVDINNPAVAACIAFFADIIFEKASNIYKALDKSG